MVWDLRRALLKKEEFESARLMNFEFRQRARATRLLARELGLEEDALVREIAERDESSLLAHVAGIVPLPQAEVSEAYARCLTRARVELIGEIGDPTPHRLG